jgi:ABC-2 type transport system ATP-binding protein
MLEIANLSHTYANGTVALDDVSLSIPRGMFGLLGPNGAGKSTLMRTVATLQEPTAGSITFGDIDVLAEPQRLRKTLGYLPQDFGVYPRVSAYAMLDQMAVLKGVTSKGDHKTIVETLLSQTNLWAVRDKSIAGFSGGMRQRFGIAQALIGNPELIIVDEPTAGLDPEERVRFHNLLADIASDVVVILSTHIVSDVEDLCAQFAVINKGHLLLTGRPADYVASLVGRMWSRAVDKSEIDTMKDQVRVVSTRLAAGRTVVRAYGESSPGAGFEPVSPDLEDVYFCTIAGYLKTSDGDVAPRQALRAPASAASGP